MSIKRCILLVTYMIFIYFGLLLTNYKFRSSFFFSKNAEIKNAWSCTYTVIHLNGLLLSLQIIRAQQMNDSFRPFCIVTEVRLQNSVQTICFAGVSEKLRFSSRRQRACLLCNKQVKIADRPEVLAVFSLSQFCKQLCILRIPFPIYFQNK